MSGGCFTITSLGVCRARWAPQRGAGSDIDWRLMLPLSLSYDHRLINGADAARCTRRFVEVLADPSALAR
jgi:pyruvate dehydrogenase E2 component (dihydrolipoamide acetyltransferase)